MKWLVDTFYLHPIPIIGLTIAIYAVILMAAIWHLRRAAGKIENHGYPRSLRPITLNQYLRDVNNSRDSYIDSRKWACRRFTEYTAGRIGISPFVVSLRAAYRKWGDMADRGPYQVSYREIAGGFDRRQNILVEIV